MSCYLKTTPNPLDLNQMNTNFVFTRYLYEKDEVKLALLIALLNKKDEALFWAYELYYSGFVNELVDLLWKIYYDFYATLNPQFEEYLCSSLTNIIKNKNTITTKKNEKLIYTIINDFIIKPYNVDVFILDQLRNTNIEKEYLENLSPFKTFKPIFEEWLDSHDYINIALYILEDCSEEDLDNVIESYVLYFSNYVYKMNKTKMITQIKNTQMKNNQNKRKIILSRIIGYYSILNDLKMGKNIRIDTENDDFEFDFESYKTISVGEAEAKVDLLYPYKILPKACKYNIDSTDHLSLFHLKRDKNEIKNAYLHNWLYFASFSPIWKERISKYHGLINHQTQSVTFANDDNMESFYNGFGYEPDEQKIDVQNKCIQNIENKRTWTSFYEEHIKNCLIDMDSNYLTEFTKIHY